MKKQDHLPMYGVGPLYVWAIVVLTILGLWLARSGRLPGTVHAWLPVWVAAGIVLIAAGAYLWYRAVIAEKIDKSITSNELRTTGVYAWVRNPIYSGIAMALTGCLLLAHNLLLLVLPVVFWLFMTVLMKHTEEKWLFALYGEQYVEYCGRVNRCIPWPPRIPETEEDDVCKIKHDLSEESFGRPKEFWTKETGGKE